MKAPTLLGLLFMLFTMESFGQISSNPEDESLHQITLDIKKHNILEDQVIGIHNDTSIQYKRYMKLQNKYTIDELTSILKNESNSVLKLYAYVALINKRAHIDEGILNKLLKDSSTIIYQSGCNVNEMTVGSFIKTYGILGTKLVH